VLGVVTAGADGREIRVKRPGVAGDVLGHSEQRPADLRPHVAEPFARVVRRVMLDGIQPHAVSTDLLRKPGAPVLQLLADVEAAEVDVRTREELEVTLFERHPRAERLVRRNITKLVVKVAIDVLVVRVVERRAILHDRIHAIDTVEMTRSPLEARRPQAATWIPEPGVAPDIDQSPLVASPPVFLGPVVGGDPDGLPEIRVWLAAELLIEDDVDIDVDVARASDLLELAGLEHIAVQRVDRVVQLALPAIFRRDGPALVILTQIEVVVHVIPIAERSGRALLGRRNPHGIDPDRSQRVRLGAQAGPQGGGRWEEPVKELKHDAVDRMR